MTSAYHAVNQLAQQPGVNKRIGAYPTATSRIAEAVGLRGWVWSEVDGIFSRGPAGVEYL